MKKRSFIILLSMFMLIAFSNLHVDAAANTVYVSTPNELVNALEDSYIEQIVFEKNITIDQSYIQIAIASKSIKKIINGNGFSFTTNNIQLSSGPGLYFNNLKDSLISIESAGSITVDHVINSSIKNTRFTNTFTIKNSQLKDTIINGAEEIKIFDSVVENTSLSGPFYPWVLSNVTLIDSPLAVSSAGSTLENIKIVSSKPEITPLLLSGNIKKLNNISIKTAGKYGMVVNGGTLILEGQTFIQDATQSAISLLQGNLYIQGSIHQVGNAYTIQTTRENVFKTQVHDLYGGLKRSQDSNLVSYYNTDDRVGEEPALPNVDNMIPVELKPVTFLKQDYNEIVGQTDRDDIIIMMKDGNGETSRTRPDRYGEYSFTLSNQPVGSTVFIYAFSPDGNQSKVQKFTIDNIASKVPLNVSSIYESDKAVTGKTSPNAQVFVNKEGSVIGSGKADSEGFFNFKLASIKVKDNLEIYAQDTFGNNSVILNKIVDSPFIYTEKMSSETAVTGTVTSETPVKVEALVKGKPVGTSTSSKGKPFAIKIPKYPSGTAVEVTGYDGDRKIKKVVKINDLTPPPAPVISTVDDNDTIVKGKTEKFAAIKLYLNNHYTKSTTSDKDGKFAFNVSKQKAGTAIKVTATDKANNTSIKVIQVIDKTPPKVPTVSTVDDNDTTVKGKTEKFALIKLYLNNKYYKRTTSDKNGNFTFKVSKQKAGTVIKVTATDKANNTSMKVIKVIDKTPPKVPSVNKLTYKTKIVTGKSEKGATIYIYKGKTKLGKTVVDHKGYFKITIKSQKHGTTLTLFVKDKAGNISKKKYIKVS